MKINQATIDLIKKWEGFRARAYKDAVGIWTIGYGTTVRAGVGIDPKPGMVISETEAEYYLEKAVNKFAASIRPAITAEINENEFGAFVSLAYNIGPTAFKRSSSLRHFNAGDKKRAAANMALWNKATVRGKRLVLKGLSNRRADEQALFRKPVAHTPPPPDVEPVEARKKRGWFSWIWGK